MSLLHPYDYRNHDCVRKFPIAELPLHAGTWKPFSFLEEEPLNLKLNKPAVETATQSAVIHIGASSIGLLVGQVSPETGICEVVEVLSRPVPLAADIFEHGYIRPTTMDACTDALRMFLASISETVGEGALPGRVHATNILAEASNEDVFLNRVSITCGMEVATLDDG